MSETPIITTPAWGADWMTQSAMVTPLTGAAFPCQPLKDVFKPSGKPRILMPSPIERFVRFVHRIRILRNAMPEAGPRMKMP
nr:hypothetical protein CPGR_01007 [Mycolicibacterium malmesburyense]